MVAGLILAELRVIADRMEKHTKALEKALAETEPNKHP